MVDISKELLEAHGNSAKQVAEKVYELIPDRMQLDVRIASPIIHVPVAGLGIATFSLGHLQVVTPEPCAYDDIALSINLTDTALRADCLFGTTSRHRIIAMLSRMCVCRPCPTSSSPRASQAAMPHIPATLEELEDARRNTLGHALCAPVV